ncbi:WD40 repeat domain-containing protein [Thalassotalea piscium]
MIKFSILNTPALWVLCLFISACSDNAVIDDPALITQHYATEVLKAADISQDGHYSLVSNNHQVCLWNNMNNQKVYPCIDGPEGQLIELVGISKSNKYFYTSNRVNVHLYQLDTGRLITVWSAGDNIINDIAMSADDSTMILGFRNGQASIVGVHNSKINTFSVHRLDINSVNISDNGLFAFTGSSDKSAKLWQTQNGKVVNSFKHKMRVNHVTLSPDAKVAFSLDAVSDRFFWLLPSGQLFSKLKSSARFIEFNQSQFSSNKQWLLTGGPKQKLQLWRLTTGELVSQWRTFKSPDKIRSSVLSVKFINNETIASLTSDGVYQTWQIPTTK